MGAQVPGAAFACISKLSDALSVRGDKKYAMRCRKKPRDALSVRRNNVLSGIAAVSATDIWAAGYTTDPSTGLQQTLTEHWDGTSWSVIASPNAAPAGSSTLAGVTALGDGTVVAVGTISTNSNNNGLILQR